MVPTINRIMNISQESSNELKINKIKFSCFYGDKNVTRIDNLYMSSNGKSFF